MVIAVPMVVVIIIAVALLVGKGKVCIQANWPIRPELIPVSVAGSD